MARKRVFISFDYDHDRNYRYLLTALAKNPRSDIEFDDLTPSEIQSYDIGRIKGVLTQKIQDATHTLVVIGKHANSYHPDSANIGTRNWQWWEIEKSAEKKKKFIAVKIERANSTPTPLEGKGATWAHSFKVDSILQAIDNA
jgi:hypothetical protein